MKKVVEAGDTIGNKEDIVCLANRRYSDVTEGNAKSRSLSGSELFIVGQLIIFIGVDSALLNTKCVVDRARKFLVSFSERNDDSSVSLGCK